MHREISVHVPLAYGLRGSCSLKAVATLRRSGEGDMAVYRFRARDPQCDMGDKTVAVMIDMEFSAPAVADQEVVQHVNGTRLSVTRLYDGDTVSVRVESDEYRAFWCQFEFFTVNW